MKLLELSLFNFCIYRGEQSFNLCPERKNGKTRPVILVGGINGGGKTTFFDAILLVLYGARANCSKKKSNQAYHNFLSGCIHRGVDKSDGASISLSFEYAEEGVERIYEIKRIWSETGSKVKETLTVNRDGVKDVWLSKNWNQVVEEIIPLGISQLFFFDAEKIRFIAEDESTSEALGTAIKSLLGLDLAERLIADSKVIEMKLREKEVSTDDAGEVDALKTKLEVATSELTALKQDRSSIQNELERSQLTFEKAEKTFAQGGGEHWAKREEVKSNEQSLEAEKQVAVAGLMDLAFGSLPLTMLSELTDDVKASDDAERVREESMIVGAAIETYNARVVKGLKKKKVPKQTLELLGEIQRNELPTKTDSSDSMIELQLSEQARSQVHQLQGDPGKELANKVKDSINRFEDLQSKLDSVKRSLAATPQEDEIKLLSEGFKLAAKDLGKIEQRANSFDQQIAEKNREQEDLQKQLESKLLKHEAQNVKATDSNRMAALAGRTREAMREFLKRSTAAKIDRLSDYIYESFQYLLRKKSLVENIQIDPESFEITLMSKDGSPIPKQRLSEGEKQIFAISVLWGLARASNRRLPAIIDTPMGRLDSAHRDNLLKRYFPNASHQTVILSTDTEVDERYFNLLEQNVTRAYSLKYNEKKRETKVEEGYFWKTDKVGAK